MGRLVVDDTDIVVNFREFVEETVSIDNSVSFSSTWNVLVLDLVAIGNPYIKVAESI